MPASLLSRKLQELGVANSQGHVRTLLPINCFSLNMQAMAMQGSSRHTKYARNTRVRHMKGLPTIIICYLLCMIARVLNFARLLR
jgi:hypothetical protein